MRLLWIAGVVGIACGAAIVRPDGVIALYQQVYPSDPAQRAALERCSVENRSFDRLDSAAREACYRRSPLYHTAAASQPRPPAAPNFVDQWRAAGQGRLQPNDIRAEQRGELYMRAAAAPAR